MKKAIKGFLIFIVTFLVYHLIGSTFFPVDEENVLQAPDWYPILGIAIAAVVTYLLCRSARKKKTSKTDESAIAKQKRAGMQAPISKKKPSIPVAVQRNQQNTQAQEFRVDPIYLSPLAHQAALVSFEIGQASISMIQRRLKLGYAAAARIVDCLEASRVVSPFDGAAPRRILISKEEYLNRVIVSDEPRAAPAPEVDIQQIIAQENEWRIEQLGLSPVESELHKVDAMEGHQFERWCAGLLEKNGFSDIEVTPGSGDQGVDIIAVKDGIRYAIQCKCYSSDLGNKPIQEVNTGKAIYHCQVGAVMTNRYFTAGARQAAEATGTLLWDRDKLIEMLEK